MGSQRIIQFAVYKLEVNGFFKELVNTEKTSTFLKMSVPFLSFLNHPVPLI